MLENNKHYVFKNIGTEYDPTWFIRFDDLNQIFWFDERVNNPRGLGFSFERGEGEHITTYKRQRTQLTDWKIKIIQSVQKDLAIDKDFLELIYKAKTDKRKFEANKFCGNISIPAFAAQQEKMFRRSVPGAKKATINMAFQVGTFVNGNYAESAKKIVKTILMAQAMGIRMNIDVFDSDSAAINNENSYVICNIAKSHEKLDYRKLLCFAHHEFFSYTLFNGYSASGKQYSIYGFLSEQTIVNDLGKHYDIIGGNMLNKEIKNDDMCSRILKIGLGNSLAQ